MIVDDELYKEVVSFVKSNRPRSFSSEERLDILLLQAHMRHEHEIKNRKIGPG